MNAKSILGQIMKEAQGSASGAKGNSTGDRSGGIGAIVRELSSRLGGHRATEGGGNSDMSRLLGTGAMGLLVGSKRGRRMGGKAFKYSALASLGSLAWKAWQDHQAEQKAGGASRADGEPVERLEGEDAERRSLEILQAMIMAARADGHIDEGERTRLTEQIDSMGADDELHGWLEEQLRATPDARTLARQADSPQAAREIYVASVAMVDDENAMERSWLDELAKALGIEPDLARRLEREVTNASSAA